MSHSTTFTNPAGGTDHMPSFVNPGGGTGASAYFGGLFPVGTYWDGHFPETAGSSSGHMPPFDNGATAHPHMPAFVNP